ncbi:hypothetical protein MC7420_2307 [Coleofasciculus chthonoplastes PCC 7420]|uniref:Uncharacterized protein n=1 Tax=Coleofasciculus chthonoplastes PCC 7420 TaxID=118168 RepID=B4VS15_9CYAN|nr:hypothetical protein MC7420_2307 [Coleofasciculus chthonoplastes PCC 7420]
MKLKILPSSPNPFSLDERRGNNHNEVFSCSPLPSVGEGLGVRAVT